VASGDVLAIFDARMAVMPTTNYPQFVMRNLHPCLAFDTTTQETVYFEGYMPANYAGGNLVVICVWDAATATTGTIGWDVTFERQDAGTLDVDADSFATAQTITAATVSGTSGVRSATQVTCTAGSTGTDSVAAGDPFRLRVRRDVANDTAAGDANLVYAVVKEA
jgi:hypothetical protein